jgi:SAM-dependent methyltransferase
MKESRYDEKLNVQTEGNQQGFHPSFHYYPYEPTPYRALETLFQEYALTSSDQVVDFGCGKGRLSFLIHHLFGASVTGIEMNETFYQEAVVNQQRYLQKAKNRTGVLQFRHGLAQEYKIDPFDNRFYFFNPFSVQIFMKVMNNILLSAETSEREMELILYYPSEDYIYFLDTATSFQLKQEVMVPELSKHNSFERFLIYRLA